MISLNLVVLAESLSFVCHFYFFLCCVLVTVIGVPKQRSLRRYNFPESYFTSCHVSLKVTFFLHLHNHLHDFSNWTYMLVVWPMWRIIDLVHCIWAVCKHRKWGKFYCFVCFELGSCTISSRSWCREGVKFWEPVCRCNKKLMEWPWNSGVLW